MVSRLIVLHLMVYGWVYGADGQPKLLTDADDGDKKLLVMVFQQLMEV